MQDDLSSRTFVVDQRHPQAGDDNPGTADRPLKTIQRAAELARPGDVVTVHAGVYRECVRPPRGGSSDAARIVFRAAPGEKVEIKGSEIVKGWVKVQDGVWKVIIPNSFFGGFNPYSDLIHGDWFADNGRKHHTGAVYLNGEWLDEARALEEVMKPAARPPSMPGRVKKPPPAAAGAPTPGLPGWVMVRLKGCAAPGAVEVLGGAENVRAPREP